MKKIGITLVMLFTGLLTISAQSKFNRNIPNDAHIAIGKHIKCGIAVLSFAPNGGWILITKSGKMEKKNIPIECENQVKSFLAKGHKIMDVSFPSKGGNSWVVLTDKAKFARNIPAECNKQLDDYYRKGSKPIKVSFSPKGNNNWVIVKANGDFFARNIDDECYQILRNLRESDMPGKKASRKITSVTFAQNGGFVILAEDYHFARNIDSECFTKMNAFNKAKNLIKTVVFMPNGRGWSIISNNKTTNTPKDLIRSFERNVAGKSIWQRMKELNVPGASVGVVINGKLAWTTSYGHLKKGDRTHAVHPESMFQVASISKVVAAMGAYKLTEQRKVGLTQNLLTANQLNWQKPFHDLIINQSWTKNFKHVTILNILNHKSGIEGTGALLKNDKGEYEGRNSDGNFEGGGYDGYNKSQQIPSLKNLVDEVKITYNPPSKPNNRKSWYSGKAFTLLQKLTSDISQRNYPDWMEDNILKSMGMMESAFTIKPEIIYPKSELTWGHDGSRKIPVRHRYPEYAAAGLYSNAVELGNLIVTINNNGLFNNKKIISSTSATLLANGNGTNLSDGDIKATNAFYSHGGSNKGYRAYLIGFKNLKGIDGIDNAGIIVLTNSDNRSFRYNLVNSVIKAYSW